MLEPGASSQISQKLNNRQNRPNFETVDIRAEDTDVMENTKPLLGRGKDGKSTV
jgi:hypothetical protein